jgi:hypothetical protein
MDKLGQRICDRSGCKKPGVCRAPKTRELRDYYWFCAAHAAAYNKSWNYCAGMSVAEIEALLKADETWRSETFRFGLKIGSGLAREALDDPLGLFSKYTGSRLPRRAVSQGELKAMRVLSLGESYTLAELKSAYKKKAFALHPDRNGGDKASEERFKAVVAAYHFLLKKHSAAV